MDLTLRGYHSLCLPAVSGKVPWGRQSRGRGGPERKHYPHGIAKPHAMPCPQRAPCTYTWTLWSKPHLATGELSVSTQHSLSLRTAHPSHPLAGHLFFLRALTTFQYSYQIMG